MVSPEDAAAKVAAAQALAAKISSSLKPPVPVFPGDTAPPSSDSEESTKAQEKAREAAARINALLGLNSDPTPPAPPPPPKEYPVPGYTGAGGPVLSAKEAEGLKYGLHRSGFSQPTQVKLLVGMEISLASAIGFDLLEKLEGSNCANLTHIMKQCPGVLIKIAGRGSVIGGEENLHFLLTSRDKRALGQAKVLADSLVMTVRQAYDAVYHTFHARNQPPAHYIQPPIPVPCPYAGPPQTSQTAPQVTGTNVTPAPQAAVPPEDLYDPLLDVSDSDEETEVETASLPANSNGHGMHARAGGQEQDHGTAGAGSHYRSGRGSRSRSPSPRRSARSRSRSR